MNEATTLLHNRHYGVRQALAAMFLDTERRGSMVRAKMERVQSSYDESELGHIMRAIIMGKLGVRPGSKRWEFLRIWASGDHDANFWSHENKLHMYWAKKHVAKEMRHCGLREQVKKRRYTRRESERYVHWVLRAHELKTGERSREHEGPLRADMLSMETLVEVEGDAA